jgi:hypothetical protein
MKTNLPDHWLCDSTVGEHAALPAKFLAGRTFAIAIKAAHPAAVKEIEPFLACPAKRCPANKADVLGGQPKESRRS